MAGETMSILLTTKSEMFGNFLDSVSIFLLRLRLAHPLKYFYVTLELRLADSVSLFHTLFPTVDSTLFAKTKSKEFSSEYGSWLVKWGCNASVLTVKIFKHYNY